MTKKYLKKQLKSKKNRLNKRTRKNKSQKKQKAGCQLCSVHPQNIPNYIHLKGGSNEQPSFSNVPLHSFYELNTYNDDPLNQQISTRIQPNIIGGKRKSKKINGGYSDIVVYNTTDPLLNGNSNILLTQSNTSGAILGANILSAIPNTSYLVNSNQFLV